MFDQFARKLAVERPLTILAEGMGNGQPLRIGVEAEHFLDKFTGKEPLNGALGGDPLSLEDKVMAELRELQKMNCQIIFYFHGCIWGPYIEPFTAASAAAKSNSRAFTKYEEAQPKEAIEIFKSNGEICCPLPASILISVDFSDKAPVLEWLKSVLGKNGIPFLVAPFSAHAQMVDAFNQNAIDAYYASTELFLFGAGQIIWSIDVKLETQKGTNAEGAEINVPVANAKESRIVALDWVDVVSQFPQTQNVDIAVKDAMLLAGSSRLPAFSPVSDTPFEQAVNTISRLGSVEQLIQQAQVLEGKAKSEYWEKFVATSASITHMVIINHINETSPRTGAHAPGDLQQALAARLPDELSYYMSTGLISPKVLNWFVTHKIPITAPFDGGDQLYRKVIRETLNPVRQRTYGVLAANLARYYQFTATSTEYWFGAAKHEFKGNEVSVSQPSLSSWRVRDRDISQKAKELKLSGTGLLLCLASLQDPKFPVQSISKKDAAKWDVDPLTSETELVYNTTWRMLMLRDYVDKDHQLTPWGKVALAALQVSSPTKEQLEAVFVAIEMLRAGHFTPKTLMGDHSGEEINHQYTWLVSKIVTTGQMAHLSKGYSGPLSRRLLAFHASVSAVRTSLRDLVEATMANLFLCGDGERVRDDHVHIAKDLPFQGRFSCGLGILISTYLDEYHSRAATNTLSDINAYLKSRMQGYCAHTLVGPSLDRAVNIWDAFMAGVRAAGDLINKENRTQFEEVDNWFAGRRPGTKDPVIANGE